MGYLIFNTEADAVTRADSEGSLRGYAYWNGDSNGTRWHTYPEETGDSPSKWALDVSEYTLNSDESPVDSYTPIDDNFSPGEI